MLSENSFIEFKRELNDKLEKTVISFLNSKTGGDIFIGINDDGSIVGVKNIDETQLAITDRIKNNISPSCLGLFDVYSEEKANLKVIHIVVSAGTEKPYYLKSAGMSPKGCFIRIGTGTKAMEIKQIKTAFPLN